MAEEELKSEKRRRRGRKQNPRHHRVLRQKTVVNNSAGISVEGAAQTRQLLLSFLPMLALSFVPPVFAVTNLIHLFIDVCDSVGQVICVGLAIFSFVAWTIMFGKHFELKRLRQYNQEFERRLRAEKAVLEVPEGLRNQRTIPYVDLFADAIESYWRAAAIGKDKGADNIRARLEHAENALQRALARQTLRYESNMIFLATIVTGAPFLGLLGTVWGVMTAFSDVSVQQTASIQTLAPGVSAALLTTIAGLLVAIPSVFGYNILLASTKRLITEMENYASELADRIELESK
jgi:biopolymer transport protein TolQ